MSPARLIQPLLLLALTWGAGLQAAGKEAWVEVKSPHFVAYTDAGEAEARKVLKGFEVIRSVFGQVFPGIRVDPPRPMIIFVVENEAAMKRFLPHLFGGRDPVRPVGEFIPGDDRNYAILRQDIHYQIGQPYSVVFHEYTHSIVHLNFPSLPTWLDEGIADFYGATEIHSDHVYVGRVPTGRLQLLQSQNPIPLSILLRVTHDSPYYQEGSRTGHFYAQSWAFAHYLFTDAQARKAGLLKSYLKALKQEADPLAAARAGLGDLDTLQRALIGYSHRMAFTFWDLPLTVKLTDQDFQSRGLEGAEALVVRAEFLQHTRQEPEACPLLEQALALAPQRPEVHVALGYGHFLNGQREQARAAFAEALRLGSRDFRPPYYLARLAQDDLDRGTPEARQILDWLETARSLRPDFPGVHLALGRQYSRTPRDPGKALQEGAEAVRLDPKDLATRANFGGICLSLGEEEQARAIGEQLRRMASSEQERRMAVAYASELDRYLERKQALAASPDPLSGAMPGPTPLAGQIAPIKFSLPDYLEPLGREVVQLVSEGKLDEAIRKVEKAIAQANYPYDRKALRPLLETLKKRSASK